LSSATAPNFVTSKIAGPFFGTGRRRLRRVSKPHEDAPIKVQERKTTPKRKRALPVAVVISSSNLNNTEC